MAEVTAAGAVGAFFDEGRAGRRLKIVPAMRRQAVRYPDHLHRRDRQPDRLGHRPDGLLRHLVWRCGEDEAHHLGGLLLRDRRRTRRPRPVAQEPVDALGDEPFLPLPDRRLPHLRLAYDLVHARSSGSQEHDPCPPDKLLRAIAVRYDRLQATEILDGDGAGDPVRIPHPRTGHAAPNPLSGFFRLDQSARALTRTDGSGASLVVIALAVAVRTKGCGSLLVAAM